MIFLAWRLAWRDLRGRKAGLFIVLLCLGIGVASISGIGALQAVLNQGIADNGRAILGGDMALSTGLAPFPAAVLAWFQQANAAVSQTLDFRSILVAPSGRRLLAAVRAVGPGWPLLGQVATSPDGAFAGLARGGDGQPGLLLAPTAAASLGLHPGDMVTLGGIKFAFRGTILASPDSLGDGQLFGAKTFVAASALAGSNLVQPGGLVTYSLQVRLPATASLPRTEQAFAQAFPGNPWRLGEARNAAPDIVRFVGQAALFMTLLGLAALLVGGIGVANGVEAWLATRARSIATLRCLGAPGRLITMVYGLQLLALGVPAIMAGDLIGAVAPLAVAPLLRGKLPLPHHIGLYPRPLLLAAAFGLLVGLLFTLPPLRRAASIPGAALFRLGGLPRRADFSWRGLLLPGVALLALLGLIILYVPRLDLALGFCAGTAGLLLLLRGIAWLMLRWLPSLPQPRDAAFALGLRRLYGPASSLPLMLLSAGAGLTILVAVAEIRGNLLAEFNGALPQAAPSFYFIDIQPPDVPKFGAAISSAGGTTLQTMPSLRARILAVRGIPVDQFHPPGASDWPLRTDIGFTYAPAPPPGTVLADGNWWPADYLGPPLVSFDADLAKQWGLKRGDTVTVDVLGRVFTLQIANLRKIHWQSLQLNFLMIGTPDPFAGAPYSIVATVKANAGREGAVLAAVTNALPDVTGIDVQQILQAFATILSQTAFAVSVAGLVALLAGFLVLVSAAAAEREMRIAEAVILKTLGASRAQIRRAWLIEFGIAGGLAGMVAALFGTLTAAVTVRRIFQTEWYFQPYLVATIIAGSILVMTIFGYLATAKALREPAGPYLRQTTGG